MLVTPGRDQSDRALVTGRAAIVVEPRVKLRRGSQCERQKQGRAQSRCGDPQPQLSIETEPHSAVSVTRFSKMTNAIAERG